MFQNQNLIVLPSVLQLFENAEAFALALIEVGGVAEGQKDSGCQNCIHLVMTITFLFLLIRFCVGGVDTFTLCKSGTCSLFLN